MKGSNPSITISGYNQIKKHEAQEMAEFIEKWLGHPLSKKMLCYCTARCGKCGRRIEAVLKKYAGEKQKLCPKCRIVYSLVSTMLNYIVSRTPLTEQELKKNLADPMLRKGLSSVLEGISLYGPQKPFTGKVPFLVVWNITKACNLACKHCYEDAHVRAKDELNTIEALQTIDKMADMGIAYIAFSGGEPLIRPDFFTLAEHARKKEIAFSIASNATLMTREMAKKLKNAGCAYVQISLDGATAKTHNSFRGKDAFERTIQGIKNAVAEGLTVGIACTVTKHNLKEVKDVVGLAEKLGVYMFMHYNFIPTGRGEEIVELDITPKEREELLNYLASQIGKRKIHLLSTAPQFSRVCSAHEKTFMTHFDIFGQEVPPEYNIEFLAEFIGGCGAGRLYFALEPNGDILPCVFILKKLGNIRTASLEEIWLRHPDLLALRDRKAFKGNCGTCENRNICGGCRARAYGYYRDFQACDPGCTKNLEAWKSLVENAVPQRIALTTQFKRKK